MRTSIPPKTTEDSAAPTSQETFDILPYAMGGAVGGTVVIIAILLVVVIVSLLVRKSRGKPHRKVESNNNIGLLTYNNALYDVGKETGTCNAPYWQLHCSIYSLAHSDVFNCMVSVYTVS